MQYLLRAAVLSAFSVLISAAAMAQYPALGPPPVRQPGVLLLRNGQVLTGEIARIEDRYSILMDRGEIRLHGRDVECVCRDLEEAYRQKCLQSRADCVEDHLDLAQWCQANGLLAHASDELAQAAALNPSHPLIPLVQRKIQNSAEPIVARAQPASSSPDSHEPSVEELDRMVRGMPSGAVEMFTQSIQPMLTNTCTVSACHGTTTDNNFRLLRIPSGRPPSRRLTQRNLHAVVKLINWEDPSKSPLLTAPIQPHGTSRTAIFTDRQVDSYQELVRWVYLVAQGKKVEREKPRDVVAATHTEGKLPRSAVMPASHNMPIGPHNPMLSEGQGVVPATAEMPVQAMPSDPAVAGQGAPAWGGSMPADGALPVPGTPMNNPNASAANQPMDPRSTQRRETPAPGLRGQRQPGEPPRVQRGVRVPQYAPADAFDPEVFNRQFAPPPAQEGQ